MMAMVYKVSSVKELKDFVEMKNQETLSEKVFQDFSFLPFQYNNIYII